ncbi:MAG: NifU family protein [Candidatus Kapabacteria bacterium]|nr:NifU family protein [Candidatus Kapabacteria bacterium]
MNSEITNQITAFIQQYVASYVESHGGTITFESFSDGIVSVSLTGACHGCSARSITIQAYVNRMLRKQFHEVDKVVLAE